ncbi:MAG: hypothetical protein FWB85_09745 [Chitinispirillia bacterium]|nr:hypothetical protein [Chitinispirillia bacterium]MCL2242482.1 hypothetical protein [Chitinispirillia bacterium]
MARTLVLTAALITALMADGYAQKQDGVKLLESMSTDYYAVTFEYDDKNRIVKIGEYGALTYNGNELASFNEDAVSMDISRKGNTINVSVDNPNSNSKHTITVNSGGYITKRESEDFCYVDCNAFEGESVKHLETFHYTGANLTKVESVVTDDPYNQLQKRGDKIPQELRNRMQATSVGKKRTMEFKYDDKKSPFLYCNTPKWFLQHYVELTLGLNNNNNVIERKDSDGTLYTYRYEYDSDGFPTRRIAVTKRTEEGKTVSSTETTTFSYRREGVLTPSAIVDYGSHMPSSSPFSSDGFFHFSGYVGIFREENSQWHFGQYKEEFSSSSALPPSKSITYYASNLRNEDYRAGGTRGAAWCEGVKGYGIGERVDMQVSTLANTAKSEDAMYFKSLMIVNGYTKNETTWRNNTRVKTLRLYVGGKHWCDLQLNDVIKPQVFNLPENLRIYPKKSGQRIPIDGNFTRIANSAGRHGYQLDLSFEILEVYPGAKFDDTCITGIALDIFGGVAGND